jgi:sugar phosphate isomerase/epimerase
VRDHAARDFVGVLDRVAEIGYLGVELVDLHGMPAAEFRAHVERLGLEVIGSHLPLLEEDELPKALAELEKIGTDVVLCGLEAEEFTSREAIAQAVERFNRFAAGVHDRGMTLGYHNHWWEFTRSEEGWVPMSVLLEQLDPGVFLEVDVYWLATAGVDVAATLTELGERVRRLHLKDGPCNQSDPQTAVGAGRVDLAGAIAAAPQVDWHAAELDECAGDMLEALEESYQYLTNRGFSRGRTKEVRM